MFHKAVILTLALLAAAAGCQSDLRARSHISGIWEAIEVPSETVTILADGTFDLSNTMVPLIGDPYLLRRAGDSLYNEEDGSSLEIVSSHFAPTTSHIRFRARTAEGTEEYAQLSAELGPDGLLHVIMGRLSDESGAMLRRKFRRVGAAPNPSEIAYVRRRQAAQTGNKWIDLGSRRFGENWCEQVEIQEVDADTFLIVPFAVKGSKPLLVARIWPSTNGDVHVLDNCPDAVKTGSAILLFRAPELNAYGRPSNDRVNELALTVCDRIRRVTEGAAFSGCVLETYTNGVYVGHFIWQRDNALFDAWYCGWPLYFAWYGTTENTDKRKVALFDIDRNLIHPSLIEQAEGNLRRYQAEGFVHAKEARHSTGSISHDEVIRLLRQETGERRDN